MSQAGAGKVDPARDWLSLGPASRLLGVDPDTLRRWADDGRVRSYATPGGHRRFARSDVDQLRHARRPGRQKLANLGATPARLTRAYARSYRAASQGPVATFEDDDRAALRDAGRRLLESMLAYLDAASAGRKAALEAEAVEAVAVTARRLAASGASLSVAVETFIASRGPFLTGLESIGRSRGVTAAAMTSLFAEAVALLDRLLIHFVRTFQDATTEA